jgi:hypothetical protein
MLEVDTSAQNLTWVGIVSLLTLQSSMRRERLGFCDRRSQH